jgi:hypothetical protein
LGDGKRERRSVHRTQWAAQFAVASELCKRGYEVALTMGNHPSVDIMVVSPGGQHFGIDVKGVYTRNFWLVKPKPVRPDLFYVLAYVPDGAPNRFFVLTQTEANGEIETEVDRARQRAIARGGSVEKAEAFPCIGWKVAETGYEDAWNKLPQ